MSTATKKPITVTFVKYTGDNDKEILDFTEGSATLKSTIPFSPDAPDRDRGYILSIPTKEGDMIVSPGDYVVKEPYPTPNRKFYPCKPEIFLASYDINN